jgi:hypothetical protein
MLDRFGMGRSTDTDDDGPSSHTKPVGEIEASQKSN